jgi:hypothetical protein
MMDSAVVAARWVARWAVDRSVGNRCPNLSNSRQLEHHLSLQHRRRIVPRLNNQSTRVWAVAAALICADQWICEHNHAVEVVGYN